MDPYDLDHVYISTPVDPRSGEPTGHYEIYSGRTPDGGTRWDWEAVTADSAVDNLRPMVVPGDSGVPALCWFRGSMRSSQAYETGIVAIVQENPAGAA